MKHTHQASLHSSVLRPSLSYGFTALSIKLERASLLKKFLTAKVCQGMREKKGSKMEHSSLQVLDSILRQPSQANGCCFLPLQDLILLFMAFLALSTSSWY